DEYFDSSKIMKSSTTNVETPINDEVFQEVSESFQGKSSSSSLNDDVQQSPEEVILPSTNTQSISINMIPNGDEASTSHNVFNERLEEAYFDSNQASEVIISFIKKTQVNLQLQVQRVRTDNGTEFKKTVAKFFDEIMKTSTTNVETSINEEVFHEVSESIQWESSSSSLNDDVQQSPKEDAYFDASTSFRDPSNVHTYYQPYPHEKKWTKDHPLHKIIGDPKSSVQTRGQLANSCLFSCLLSYIEPANVAEALRDADWVSAMQEELDQFARLKFGYLKQSKVVVVGYSQQEGIDYDETFAPTAFLNGILKEEVYVGQPPGFVSKQYPDHVYALDKALYGLKQAPRAWYDVLSKFLIEKGFQKGSIDTTLFIKKKVPTPMVEQAKLKLDLVGKPVDHADYRSMIGLLMYVTSSRPDIMFATCMCARYQANPNEHHVSAVKRIFRYLKWTINLGLWYPKDSGFDLTAYSDANHAGCHLDRKTESEYIVVSSCCAQVLWMRTQLTDYGFFYDKVPIYCDSKSAIRISCNPIQHTRTKHIDV
nr:hypothetical protein [Tanacetum cinerariifolium]